MAKQVTLMGINDSAVYSIFPEEGVKMLYKKEYSSVGGLPMLNRDTLEVGDSIKLYLVGPNPQYDINVKLDSPISMHLTHVKDLILYKKRVVEKGLFQISGVISADTVTVPFVYRYLVTDER